MSAIFAIGLLAWALTYWFDVRDGSDSGPGSGDMMTIAVTDGATGQPLPGALIAFSGGSVVTDSSGNAHLAAPVEPVMLAVSMAGYSPVYGTADASSASSQTVSLNPAVAGESQEIGGPVPEPTEAAGQPAQADQDQPFQSGDSAQSDSIDPSGPVDAGIAGYVTDEAGEPILDATILAGSSFTRSDVDGYFEIPDVQQATPVHIWASGYADVFTEAETERDLMVGLKRQDIKAAYLTGAHLTNEDTIQNLIEVANTTEINSIVVDIKEGNVYYDTNVQFFYDANAVTPVFDPAALVQRLHDNGIYAIARLVVFNDPVVAENRPDLAVKDINGGTWRGYNDAAWVNPFHRELWQPNIDLAVEAAELGFDEIQYDYVRFPSDGDLTQAEFGAEYTEEGRVGAIVDFLRQSRDALAPYGVKLAADIFAIIAVYPQDQGIGQRMADFAEVVDYICPMVYPSHYNEGSIGVDGHPNAFPYETVQITIGLGAAKVPGMELKIRPWLQDFTMGDPPYGPEEVRAEIDAAMDEGASGWMLWNPQSEVTAGALDPD